MATENLSRVQALIFDLDGTLIDSQHDLIVSVKAMLREMGRPDLPEDVISGYIGHGAPRLVSRALGAGATTEELERALQFFLAYYEEHKLDNTRPYPGVVETLGLLPALPKAVLTNKPERISIRILDALGLSQYFRVVYGGNSFATKKPDPYGTQQILRELNVSPERVLFIGDSDVDVQTARNAGTIAAIVNYGFGVYDRASNPADFSLDEFRDLIAILPKASSPASPK